MSDFLNASGQLKLAGLIVVLYTGWNDCSILQAWQHSPFDRADVVAWLIWMVPVVLCLRSASEIRLAWTVTALVLTIGGAVMDLNLCKDLAFASACAGLTAPRYGFWIWLPMSFTWMPIFGWLFSKYSLGVTLIGALRVLFSAGGTFGYVALKR